MASAEQPALIGIVRADPTSTCRVMHWVAISSGTLSSCSMPSMPAICSTGSGAKTATCRSAPNGSESLQAIRPPPTWGGFSFLKRKGMGERRGVSGQLPLAGVQFNLADAIVVAVFDRAVLAGVLVQIFGNGDIGQAVVADLLAQALLPPLYGLQPVAGFVAAEGGAGQVVEFEPAAQNVFNFFQQVDAFYFCEVARVVLAEYRDIKVVGVVADDNVR